MPQAYVRAASEVITETLWPTRCALCDAPGSLLCDACKRRLGFVDFWRACPVCGAPHGSVQCSECNPIALKSLGRNRLPFVACVCVAEFSPDVARLVTTYKDRGEVRLGALIAALMAQVVPPLWPSQIDALGVIPASARAVRRRGFDHAQLLGEALADVLGLPLINAFERPRSKDQRALNKGARAANMEGRFVLRACERDHLPASMLLVDDVFTTGATLCAASDALLAAGVQEVRCATFARVW
ncbi:MAG: phosphoribosyltransferase family protein [Raoultibacter sp.]